MAPSPVVRPPRAKLRALGANLVFDRAPRAERAAFGQAERVWHLARHRKALLSRLGIETRLEHGVEKTAGIGM